MSRKYIPKIWGVFAHSLIHPAAIVLFDKIGEINYHKFQPKKEVQYG
jgi:hypothetical protein